MERHLGLILSVALGAIWASLGAAIWGVAATLFGGVATTIPVGPAFIAGAAAGLVYALWAHRRTRPWEWFFSPALVGFIAFLALTMGTPFGVDPAAHPLLGPGGALALFLIVAWAIRACLFDQTLDVMGRYMTEVVFLRACRGLGMTFFVVLVILPFYAMVVSSLKPQASLIANPTDFSVDLTQGFDRLFSGYIEALVEFKFGRYILVSTFVSISTVILTLAFAIPGAYAVSRLRFPGRAILSRSILLIYMFPAIVLVIPLYSVFSQLALRDTLLGLLIVYPATTIPVALYMLQGYFRGIPPELEEAGIIDGCTRAGVIWRITLPLSLPALASVALYVFMIAWNEFLFAFMFLDDPDIFTLSRGLVSMNSSEVPRQFLMAGSVIVTVPILVIFLWCERYLVGGLTAGSVKG